MTTRKKQLAKQCEQFHEKYPEVWDMFVQFSFTMARRGYQNYSAYSIMQRIQWEKDAGGDGITQFKINNNFVPFYSRRFMKTYPEFDGFFKTRVQKSEYAPPKDHEPTPLDLEDYS